MRHNSLFFFGFPAAFILFAIFGLFANNPSIENSKKKNLKFSETKSTELKNTGGVNILSESDIFSGIKDTVFTDKDFWLELRIDQQMLYQHKRNGTTVQYPVSTGNNKGNDPEALESRPGLFAIFLKEEHHISSQFNASNMYHFMPFNQGIGFHSIDGTGYYAHLGVRPSSHGCIRMKHDDVKKLFSETEIGTLVLGTRGYSARTVAFAPEGFKNEIEYKKDDYKKMLAENLYNLLNGRYYLEEREKFVIDPKVIPVSGIYTSYDVKIPDKQIIPRSFAVFIDESDKTKTNPSNIILTEENANDLITFVSNDTIQLNDKKSKIEIGSTDELIKKYFNNPIGVLPYFGPKR